MKYFLKNPYLFFLLFPISLQAQTEKKPIQYVASIFAGSAIVATQGMEYNSGFGIKGGAIIKNFYVGTMLAIHSGEDFDILWSGSFNIPAGTQHYHSRPLFVEVDGGYTLPIKLGEVSTTFLPYISFGLLNMKIKSDGVYGEPDDISTNKFTFGFGLSYQVSINDHISAGLDYRMYPLGDEVFIYGDFPDTYEHGFSTSLIFGALYGVVSYKF